MASQSTMQLLISIIFLPCILIGLPILIIAVLLRVFLKRHSFLRSSKSVTNQQKNDVERLVVGYFHPYCNAGGGGERVLWCGIRAMQKNFDHVDCVVYTGDVDSTPTEILEKANERFGITLLRPIEFIYLKQIRYIEAKSWPHFTLIGQSIGSILLGLEGLWKCRPDVFIDTMGFAFTFPVFRYVGGCKIGCYVHYPTISTDMLSEVKERRSRFNNSKVIAQSRILSYGKLIYYHLFAWLYGIVGRRADAIMVNSSWTRNHIVKLWRLPKDTFTVFPPCDTNSLLKLDINKTKYESTFIRKIISVGQFRPEKDHALQVSSFARFLKDLPIQEQIRYRLSLVGSCRNADDEERVNKLKRQIHEYGIDNLVEFHVNATYNELIGELKEAFVGIHTMYNEHFGIGIVEYMAAGVIPLAHDSGGPQMDIVIEWKGKNTGFLADNEEKYAMALKAIFHTNCKELCTIAENARESVLGRFSEEAFSDSFIKIIRKLLI